MHRPTEPALIIRLHLDVSPLSKGMNRLADLIVAHPEKAVSIFGCLLKSNKLNLHSFLSLRTTTLRISPPEEPWLVIGPVWSDLAVMFFRAVGFA